MKKLTVPVVLKTGNSSLREINRLEQELTTASSVKEKKEMEMKIKNFKYGLDGEKTVLFQLKNSYMPMYILHDLHLQFEDCKAQIDFLVVTRKLVLVLECKRLYGNIYINANGNFIRMLNFDNDSQMEGMESPYTQNERHLKLIYTMCRAEQKNAIQRIGFDRAFRKIYRSVIVLANPKTIVQMNEAPEEIQNVVKRSDELIAYIEMLHKNSHVPEMSDEEMKEIAEFFLARDTEKFQNSSRSMENNESQAVRKPQQEQPPVKKHPENSVKPERNIQDAQNIEDSQLFADLRSYRYQLAQKENLKAYMICNNAQLVKMIQGNPKTLAELKKLNIFDSDEKYRKYGAGFLKILGNSVPAPAKKTSSQKASVKPEESAKSVEDSKVYGALRAYRYQRAEQEHIKPYLICNNEQLVNLIQKNPRTLKELRTLPGFDSDEKCRKYGTEILKILAEYLPKTTAPVKQPAQKKPLVKPGESIQDSKIYGALRSYRYNQAQKENIKPYMICNNDQLVRLIQANPGTIAELKKLDGFQDDEKCRKYGGAILKILKDFQ